MNISKLVWLNMEPDDETHTIDHSLKVIDRLEKEENVSVESIGDIMDFGFGRNELFKVDGPHEVVDCIETLFYEKYNEESEKDANND